ncbi:response regulator [Fodinibius sediminis]|uniref:Response regulator receiver domain-containing protein n=1 Tax=Fodinibius sediminis TaxID=1214077 RepID=A0A521C0K7_9BACT|nr:response regulator [Fodinibius sediminis]SMO52996.1 Response regulator receiver domain-containing protein [Fodinibius sediminis]
MQPDESLKVLIVEDDMIISMLLERMISKMGYEVVEKATTGQKAISLAQKHEPDIILMDIQLKDNIDGIAAMQQIRKSSEVPVIYITGNSCPSYKERAQETGYTDFLVKPIELDDLEASIQKANKQ